MVLDEADRMFSLGFESQIRSIINQCRPDRQLLLFSATMNKKVGNLATDSLSNPVRIEIGGAGVANKDIRQIVHVIISSKHPITQKVLAQPCDKIVAIWGVQKTPKMQFYEQVWFV